MNKSQCPSPQFLLKCLLFSSSPFVTQGSLWWSVEEVHSSVCLINTIVKIEYRRTEVPYQEYTTSLQQKWSKESCTIDTNFIQWIGLYQQPALRRRRPNPDRLFNNYTDSDWRVVSTCLTRCPTLGIRMTSSSKFSFPGEFFPQLSKVTKGTGMWNWARAWIKSIKTSLHVSPSVGFLWIYSTFVLMWFTFVFLRAAIYL